MNTDPQTFRHRSEEVEAIQWTGDNADTLRAFAGPDFDEIDLDDRTEDPDETAAVRESEHGTWRGLKPGDWVVRLDGGLYEFAAADFAKQYEPAPAAPESAPPTGQADEERRERYATAISRWHRDPEQPLYTQGAEAVIVIADAEQADLRREHADRVEHIEGALSRIRDKAEVAQVHEERRRLALSTALGLGTSAPWDAIRARAAELAGQAVAVDWTAEDDEGDELVCVDECGSCDACGMEPFGTPAEGWREAVRFLRRTARTSGNRQGALHGARLIETELRRLAAETPGPETQGAEPWLTDSARIGRTLIWSWSDVGKGAFREGYRAAQAEARALLGGERGTDQQPPAVVAEPGKENDPSAVCICGHTRGEHIRIGGPFGQGRLLCDSCDPDSTENLACKEFEAL